MRCTVDYRCPDCASLLFKTSGPVGELVEIHCRKCRSVVIAQHVGVDWHVTYHCAGCDGVQRLERPKAPRRYCTTCGTNSLRRLTQVEAREVERVVVHVPR